MAEVKYLHVCDYAFLAEGSKPCLIGVFKTITAHNFPATHPFFSVAFFAEAEPNQQLNFQVAIEGPPNAAVVPLRSYVQTTAGSSGGAFVVINAMGLIFTTEGRYKVSVLSGADELASTDLFLVPAPNAAA